MIQLQPVDASDGLPYFTMLMFGALLVAIIAFLRRTLKDEDEKPRGAVADTLLGVGGTNGAGAGNDRGMTEYASEIGKNVYEVGKGIAKKAKEGVKHGLANIR